MNNIPLYHVFFLAQPETGCWSTYFFFFSRANKFSLSCFQKKVTVSKCWLSLTGVAAVFRKLLFMSDVIHSVLLVYLVFLTHKTEVILFWHSFFFSCLVFFYLLC